MNNIKKIGLSALAGSLVAISANAAELAVSGSVELTYVDTGGDAGNEVTGNSFGANSGITFSGSGDVGFGTVSMTRAINDTNTGWGSSFQTLDMGDMGIVSFDSTGGALVGLTAKDDTLPTAYEESWTGVGSSGVSGVGSTNVIGYRNTFEGVSISAGYTNGEGATSTGESAASGAGAHGSTADLHLEMNVPELDGFTLGLGISDSTASNKGAGTSDTQTVQATATYTIGPVALGYRMAEVNDGLTGAADHAVDAFSIAFNVNDNFAISYGEVSNEQKAIAATAAVTNDIKGYSAAYTMGAASIRFNHSSSDNDAQGAAATHTVGANDETTEISLALSF
ncbi:porin [Candidatus Pelagibacter sp.]|nr:porin [Candidatus Pelagibacter sp.]